MQVVDILIAMFSGGNLPEYGAVNYRLSHTLICPRSELTSLKAAGLSEQCMAIQCTKRKEAGNKSENESPCLIFIIICYSIRES